MRVVYMAGAISFTGLGTSDDGRLYFVIGFDKITLTKLVSTIVNTTPHYFRIMTGADFIVYYRRFLNRILSLSMIQW